MIRFTDVAPEAKPKKAATPAAERKPAVPPAVPAPKADAPEPAKAARKTKKSA